MCCVSEVIVYHNIILTVVECLTLVQLMLVWSGFKIIRGVFSFIMPEHHVVVIIIRIRCYVVCLHIRRSCKFVHLFHSTLLGSMF
jgi:hypothetical protein